MSGKLGLIELLLVFAAVFGWGLWELRSLRRGKSTGKTPPDPPA